MIRKGIILAGGLGTRLYPTTLGSSKQTLPIYNKPLIYYPLSVLMHADIKKIAIISTKSDQNIFKKILGNGSELGIELEYFSQDHPNGIPEAFKICKKFIEKSPSVLILGDNIFYGSDLPNKLKSISKDENSASIISYKVKDPENFGVVKVDKKNKIKVLEEKPKNFISDLCITGIYFFPKNVTNYVKNLKPSKRGELEIIDLLKIYLKSKKLKNYSLGRGYVWFDTGSHESMYQATSFVRSIETVQKYHIGNLHEIAYRKKWISKKQFQNKALKFKKTSYGEYLINLLKENF